MSIHPDPTSGLLLTDPVSGAVFRFPARPEEPEQNAAADLKEVLDVWGEVYHLSAGALAPYRLNDAEAEVAAAELLGDPEYLAHLVRELGAGESGVAELGNLMNAQTPEGFAAALGGANLEETEARLSALEVRLQQTREALAAATISPTSLPTVPADPKQHPAMLALLGLLSRVSPQWIGYTLAGKQRTPPPAAPLSIPLPALPSFSYADLLGRPLEADRES